MNRLTIFVFSLSAMVLLMDCGEHDEPVSMEYQAKLEAWRQERIDRLKAPDGWLSLAGLFYLEEGENTFGSDSSNMLVFPEKAPVHMGSLFLEGDSLYLVGQQSISILIHDSLPAGEGKRYLPLDPLAVMSYGSLSWHPIERGGRYLIRLRDAAHEAIQEFKGIDHFPVRNKWVVPAVFRPFDQPEQLLMKNVLDMDIEATSEGVLQFEVDGSSYELAVLDGGEAEWFIIFADETTGEETYPGGRYLYVAKAGAEGKTTLDFNKAYNPPCAFTEYATCLLPPARNRLALEVRAGERTYGSH